MLPPSAAGALPESGARIVASFHAAINSSRGLLKGADTVLRRESVTVPWLGLCQTERHPVSGPSSVCSGGIVSSAYHSSNGCGGPGALHAETQWEM